MSNATATLSQKAEQGLETLEHHLSWLSLVCLVIGIFWANQSEGFAHFISGLMEGFIDGYSFIAPIVIYLVLTPTLIKLVTSAAHGKKFAAYTIYWFAKVRLMACIYAVIATALIFDLPFYSEAGSFGTAVEKSIHSLGWMLTNSVYFYAVYASLITVAIVTRMPKTAEVLSKGVDLVEYLGRIIVPIIPFMMVAVGAYLTILPSILKEELAGKVEYADLGTVTMLGFPIDVTDSMGMILLYVLGALATGVVCWIWHAGLLIAAKRKMPSFSLKSYFRDYWIKVYPLLWATCSESLSMPWNLHVVKKFCPTLQPEVRQFVVGTGSFLNINGTLINVFLMTGLVAAILGVQVSVLQLLLLIPIVFLIAYGIPGIPGELVIFAGPITLTLGLAPDLMPVFLALYIGLQIGLPDSFRTAANSTDECLSAIILNDKYGT